MASDKTELNKARWIIYNNLKNTTLETCLSKYGQAQHFEELKPGSVKRYNSNGKDGRIALRVSRIKSFRVEFGENDSPGWFEVDPKDGRFNTLMFPNEGENGNGNINDARSIIIKEPE